MYGFLYKSHSWALIGFYFFFHGGTFLDTAKKLTMLNDDRKQERRTEDYDPVSMTPVFEKARRRVKIE